MAPPGGPNDPYLFGFIDSLVSIHFGKTGQSGAPGKSPVKTFPGVYLWTPFQTLTVWSWSVGEGTFVIDHTFTTGDVTFAAALAAGDVFGPYTTNEATNALLAYNVFKAYVDGFDSTYTAPFSYAFTDPPAGKPGAELSFAAEGTGVSGGFFNPHAAGIFITQHATLSISPVQKLGTAPWPGPADIETSGAVPF